MNNKNLAKSILDVIDDTSNVSFIQHCATRLRFTLKNSDNLNLDSFKKIEGVAGAVYKGGQLQLIIGPDVSNVYDELTKILPNTEGGEVDDDGNPISKATSNEKEVQKGIGSKILSAISGCIIPLIPVILAASFIKSIAVIFGPTMLNFINPESNFYILITFAGDAGFYFLPIYIGYTTAKYFKATPVLGMFMAGILLHPTLTSLVSTGAVFDVYGIPMTLVNYASSTFPIILIVWVMSYIEHSLDKFLPASLRMVFTPTLTILIMLPIALTVIGPAGTYLGTLFTDSMLAISSFGILGTILVAGLSGGLWNVLVLFGMHLTYFIAGLQLFLANGFDGIIFTGVIAASVAIAGMTTGALLRLKDKNEKGLALTYLFTQVIGGVTEPSIFGIGIKYKKPFLFACVGGFAGSVYYAITNTATYTIPPAANFLTFTGFLGSTTSNTVNGFIGGGIAFVVAAGLTYLFGFTSINDKDA